MRILETVEIRPQVNEKAVAKLLREFSHIFVFPEIL